MGKRVRRFGAGLAAVAYPLLGIKERAERLHAETGGMQAQEVPS